MFKRFVKKFLVASQMALEEVIKNESDRKIKEIFSSTTIYEVESLWDKISFLQAYPLPFLLMYF